MKSSGVLFALNVSFVCCGCKVCPVLGEERCDGDGHTWSELGWHRVYDAGRLDV